MKYFKGKKILVTGGTGSLGAEIVREIIKYDPEVIRILSRDETKQFELSQEFRTYKNLRFLIGDIRDKDRVKHAVKDIDIIFHTAALKHVYACEYNPFEAMKTNIIGTGHIIEAAVEEGVSSVIFTSTDKATNPCNTMGVSKLFAERLITSSHYYYGAAKTRMWTVRFGNIIGSRGSFIPLLKQQIKNGGPVTVTDPNMTRFFMSKKESLDLLFESQKIAIGGEVFILKMPVICIKDLVEVVIEELAPRYGYDPSSILIENIGIKPGEKMYEELITAEEMERALELDKMYVLTPQINDLKLKEFKYNNSSKVTKAVYSSHEEAPASKKDIKAILEKAGVLNN